MRLLRFPFTEFTLSTTRFFPFTEPALSATRFFAMLRMTGSEGVRVRMTRGEGLRALAHRNDGSEGARNDASLLSLRGTSVPKQSHAPPRLPRFARNDGWEGSPQ